MNMDLDQTIVHCDALLRHAVGDARYPDRQHTPLVALSREVVDTLLAAGCRNQAAVVAAIQSAQAAAAVANGVVVQLDQQNANVSDVLVLHLSHVAPRGS